ncbi:hypothetical protein CMO93_00240 [Candidatus Woesearchaeota archaeon]|nr:hypothetical protein [Candidatus Woesearchaeota archaeon]|tara:strand:+ start:1264 stop:2064 length:801 start_codon:yes stop_codon:yes gene_type:complete
MKEIKLKELEKSLESGIISKEEYKKKKKEIEEMPEEKQEKPKEEPQEEPKLKSDKILLIGIAIIVTLFAAFFGYRFLIEEPPTTIDELHEWNLKGKLKLDQGYLYQDVYSFVKFDDVWYTQFKSPQGSRFYDIQFRYGPKQVEGIRIKGSLDIDLFNNATEYYVTFNPTGNDFSHVTLAVADFNQHMTNIFFKSPIAACDKNETDACTDRPIITCDNTDKAVLYVKEANSSNVYYNDNCIVVEGSGFDLVKNVDRVLYNLYDMMEQ